MCGIAGFCDFSRANTSPAWARVGERMGETLDHRGPDDKGQWECQAGVLVHRRLAVIDPDDDKQPMERRLGTALTSVFSVYTKFETVSHLFLFTAGLFSLFLYEIPRSFDGFTFVIR